MKISLVICTRNRAAQLGPCLEAVRKIDFDQPWELVLVDNGSSDMTRAVARAFAASAKFPVTYVYEALPGLSRARNAGLRAASGELIAFTDDDCYAAPDLLKQTLAAFEDPKTGFVTGRILLHDPTDYPATINESVVPLVFPPGRYLPPGALRGANMAFRRSVLDEIGGFDPLFGSGSLFPAEDCDAAARAGRRGWVGRYVPEIVVSHHHGRKQADIESLLHHYDVGRGAYHMKLLLDGGVTRATLKGWARLPRRMKKRPATLRGELEGALGYLRCRLKGRRRGIATAART